jgi:hypothetical protein
MTTYLDRRAAPTTSVFCPQNKTLMVYPSSWTNFTYSKGASRVRIYLQNNIRLLTYVNELTPTFTSFVNGTVYTHTTGISTWSDGLCQFTQKKHLITATCKNGSSSLNFVAQPIPQSCLQQSAYQGPPMIFIQQY